METVKGYCHDCMVQDPSFFKLFDEDPEDEFYYCSFCGSNHVDVVLSDGTEVQHACHCSND